MDFASFLKDNLGHVAPILICGMIAIAIIAERLHALFWVYPLANRESFFERVQACVLADRLMDAVALCGLHQKSPVARIVREGLLRSDQPEEMIADGLHLAASEATAEVQKRTAFLSMIANVATLLGLFGTILGLIHSFQAVGSADPQKKAELLANGIATAMNATMLGLAVAIPCMVAFSILMNRANRLGGDLERASIRTVDILRKRFYGRDLRQPAAAESRNDRGDRGEDLGRQARGRAS